MSSLGSGPQRGSPHAYRFGANVGPDLGIDVGRADVPEVLDEPLDARRRQSPSRWPVRFGLDGVEYEIDLSEKNAKALRKALETWLPASRRAGGRLTRATATRVATDVDNHADWAWAVEWRASQHDEEAVSI
jgi:Lsr2